MTPKYTQLPSGRVMCSIRHDSGAIVCTSDSASGDYDKRAQEALQKVQDAMKYLNTVDSGQLVDVVV